MKRTTFFLGILGLATATTAAIGGCASFEADLCAYGICGAQDASVLDSTPNPNDASQDTKPDADPPPPGCDTPTEPLKNPEKCLVDSFGVFVSPTGSDADDGSKAKPFKTIGKALAGARSRIVVCEGDYAGSIDVTRAVEIYGGVTCDFAKAGGKPKVKASKAAYGLKIANVGQDVRVTDVEVYGVSGVAPSESSIGVFVSEAVNVKLVRVKIEAGDGAEAPPKKDGEFTFPADAMTLKGGTAVDPTKGGTSLVCPGGGTSLGGQGGNAGDDGKDAIPAPPGGLKGTLTSCQGSSAGGLPGVTGKQGTHQMGALVFGALGPTGFTGTPGKTGEHGAPGGGGGGGGGAGGTGGGGGAGGCGGQGGFGGGAGGSSIALVSFGSVVGLDGVELVAKAAKPGGVGGDGQPGQSGGARGGGGGGCSGGVGAQGGNGGSGGGGAGGLSVGMAWLGGKAPTKDASTKITHATGTPPSGGEGGVGATKGVDGVYTDLVEVK